MFGRVCYGNFNELSPGPRTRKTQDRTHTHHMEHVDIAEEADGGAVDTAQSHGVIGRSALLRLPYFDIIKHSLLDMMHLTSGVVGRHLVPMTQGKRVGQALATEDRRAAAEQAQDEKKAAKEKAATQKRATAALAAETAAARKEARKSPAAKARAAEKVDYQSHQRVRAPPPRHARVEREPDSSENDSDDDEHSESTKASAEDDEDDEEVDGKLTQEEKRVSHMHFVTIVTFVTIAAIVNFVWPDV
jgi:cobalamin biosynthesis Mg chelatase CobN